MSTEPLLVDVATAAAWRKWLAKNHALSTEVWLVFWKTHTGRPSIPFDEALDEALCFGWIDNLIRSLDGARYLRRFVPRRAKSKWTVSNRERFDRLVAQGRMTAAGREKGPPGLGPEEAAALEAHRRSPVEEPTIPSALERALQANRRAELKFQQLTPGQRRLYVRWITAAKREATQERRVLEALGKLERGEALGMK